VRKYHADTTMSLADIFGTLLAARLWAPEKPEEHQEQFKLSSQTNQILKGEQPLPIYTAIQRLGDELTDLEKKKESFQPFRWFEFTPFEMGSLDLGTWIPTWSLGRQFDQGVSVNSEREIESSFLMGIFGSAFCATVAHIGDEVVTSLPDSIASWYKSLSEKYYTDMLTIHPITPSEINNPFFHMNTTNVAPKYAKELATVVDQPHLSLMDAGMDNNLPLYPLLHPNRDIDVIIIMDASDDIEKTTWFPRTDAYVQQRGFRRWTLGLHPWQESTERPFKGIDLSAKIPPDQSQNSISVLYFPLQAHPDIPFDPATDPTCSTYNFAYNSEPYDHLMKLSETNVMQHIDTVKNVIKKTWKNKREVRLGLKSTN